MNKPSWVEPSAERGGPAARLPAKPTPLSLTRSARGACRWRRALGAGGCAPLLGPPPLHPGGPGPRDAASLGDSLANEARGLFPNRSAKGSPSPVSPLPRGQPRSAAARGHRQARGRERPPARSRELAGPGAQRLHCTPSAPRNPERWRLRHPFCTRGMGGSRWTSDLPKTTKSVGLGGSRSVLRCKRSPEAAEAAGREWVRAGSQVHPLVTGPSGPVVSLLPATGPCKVPRMGPGAQQTRDGEECSQGDPRERGEPGRREGPGLSGCVSNLCSGRQRPEFPPEHTTPEPRSSA